MISYPDWRQYNKGRMLQRRVAGIARPPSVFCLCGILANNDFHRYAVIIKRIGGIQHESSFENTRLAARRCSRDYHLDIRVFAEPVLGRVRHHRDADRHCWRHHSFDRFRHKRHHSSRYRFPRQPVGPAYAGGVAAGPITAAAVHNSGQNLWMKSTSVYDTITIFPRV